MQAAVKQPQFDYQSLPQAERDQLIDKAEKIRALARQTNICLFEIGAHLAEVRQLLGASRFPDWLKAEFEWSPRTAYNMIYVWSSFPDPESFNLEAFSKSALVTLAAPNVPEETVQEAIKMANAGAQITYTTAKAMVESVPNINRTRGPKKRPAFHRAETNRAADADFVIASTQQPPESVLSLVNRLRVRLNEDLERKGSRIYKDDDRLRIALHSLAELIISKIRRY